MYLLSIFVSAAFVCHTLLAKPTKDLPAGPGIDAHWPTAAKNGFGTSTSLRSKVWFTLANGTLTEVFYPTVDTPNTQTLQFVVCRDGTCHFEEEMSHSLRVLDDRSLSFQQINTTPAATITKTYTTDPACPTVLIDVDVNSRVSNSSVFLFYDPSLKNSGMHDSAWTEGTALIASEADVATALVSTTGFASMTNTFAGKKIDFTRVSGTDRVENGNVVQIAKIPSTTKLTIALAFGTSPSEALANARSSLRKGFVSCQRQYSAGWHAYLRSLPSLRGRTESQLKMAAMALKALEDKTYRGAIIASPSTPWGGGPNANEPTASGYHAVWSRDLYHIATALIAIGDLAAANRALNYLFDVQQRVDGSFPQNTWVDGRPIGKGLQMDQIALPIVLALQLNRRDRETWLRHIKPAADFIVARGPVTEQDRWEEKKGYSPATLAAEVAGLVCAAEFARMHGDGVSANRYLQTADDWEKNIERWTATSDGPLEGRNYFLRLTETGNPGQPHTIEINSGGGTYDQRSIVDMSFLELVRLGVRAADDPLIKKSLDVGDATIKRNTPYGPGWYRYNHDAYGERADGLAYDGRTGIGRLWTLLTGERGQFELAAGRADRARSMLQAMSRFANEGQMIPEQVWDAGKIGSGTGSATPLAWSLAQFIRLAMNISRNKNSETPAVVASRYSHKLRKRDDRSQ
jgi:glucoamylase